MLILDTSTQWLDIPSELQINLWQQSEAIVAPGNRLQAYWNQVCLQTVLPWLQEKIDSDLSVAPFCDLNFWEMVNGWAVSNGETRWIILPSEACDRAELRVPQEWVDIPAWSGDYYLAVEVDADAQQVGIWGYTTHQALKSAADYDGDDRAYSLSGDQVIQDMTIFWVMQQLGTEPTRVPLMDLPRLTENEAEALIQQLGQTSVLLPRLDVPFPQWGGLLQQDHWRQRLIAQRRRQVTVPPAVPSSTVNLGQWFETIVTAGWRSLEELLGTEPNLSYSFRQTVEAEEPLIRRAKRIPLGTPDRAVLLVLLVGTEADGRRKIWVQVLPQQGAYLPVGLQVELLTLTGETLQSVQAGEQSYSIQLRRFRCPIGSPFQVRIAISDASVTEEFIA